MYPHVRYSILKIASRILQWQFHCKTRLFISVEKRPREIQLNQCIIMYESVAITSLFMILSLSIRLKVNSEQFGAIVEKENHRVLAKSTLCLAFLHEELRRFYLAESERGVVHSGTADIIKTCFFTKFHQCQAALMLSILVTHRAFQPVLLGKSRLMAPLNPDISIFYQGKSILVHLTVSDRSKGSTSLTACIICRRHWLQTAVETVASAPEMVGSRKPRWTLVQICNWFRSSCKSLHWLG